MTTLARNKVPDTVKVLTANAESLPFPDASFDRIYSNLTLQIVTHPDKALSEARRGACVSDREAAV
jgi:ubiquinone/menaquinone biosynthesis C-methylase UbiE